MSKRPDLPYRKEGGSLAVHRVFSFALLYNAMLCGLIARALSSLNARKSYVP
jgi:hypothetical protein